jgi:hypothetical protein
MSLATEISNGNATGHQASEKRGHLRGLELSGADIFRPLGSGRGVQRESVHFQ